MVSAVGLGDSSLWVLFVCFCVCVGLLCSDRYGFVAFVGEFF